MNEDIKIRIAKATGDAMMINIMRQHLVATQNKISEDGIGFSNKEIKAADLASATNIFLIAEDENGYNYGYAELELRRYDLVRVIQVKGIFVDKKHRCKGIGEALIHKAVSIAKTLGCSQIQTSVTCDNEDAQDFFYGCGMKGIITTLSMTLED